MKWRRNAISSVPTGELVLLANVHTELCYIEHVATDKPKMGKVYLERALSKLGILSRSQANAAARAGRVMVDGVVQTDPYALVTPEMIRIHIDGQPVNTTFRSKVFLLNKPKQTVCTREDEKSRKTIFDFFQEKGGHFHSVGRLDWATTGLLLITNDTQISNYLTDPQSEIPKIYHVTARGEVTEKHAQQLKDGITSKDELLIAKDVLIRKASGKETHLVVTLTEGKNRELRRMFDHIAHEVTALKRIGYGPLTLPEIESGQYREIPMDEMRKAFPNLVTR